MKVWFKHVPTGLAVVLEAETSIDVLALTALAEPVNKGWLRHHAERAAHITVECGSSRINCGVTEVTFAVVAPPEPAPVVADTVADIDAPQKAAKECVKVSLSEMRPAPEGWYDSRMYGAATGEAVIALPPLLPPMPSPATAFKCGRCEDEKQVCDPLNPFRLSPCPDCGPDATPIIKECK